MNKTNWAKGCSESSFGWPDYTSVFLFFFRSVRKTSNSFPCLLPEEGQAGSLGSGVRVGVCPGSGWKGDLGGLLTSSVQFSSVAQLCPTLCDPMNCSTLGFPVHHHLPEFTQTHVHRVGDAIQPFHPLSSPFPPAPNPSQHQSLFQ